MLIKIDHDFHEHLTDTEKKVINFINMNTDKISSMSISDVAEATYSSPATVSRTIKKCGISGFAELRYLLTQQAETQQDNIEVNEVFNKSLMEVSNTIDHLSIDTVLSVVREIREANRIYLLSRGLACRSGIRTEAADPGDQRLLELRPVHHAGDHQPCEEA